MPELRIRKRMKRREVPGGVRFITFSCQRRLPLLGNAGIRDLFVEALGQMRAEHGVQLFAWVVMLEHVHMLVRPAEGRRLAPALASLKMSVSNQVLRRWKALNAGVLKNIVAAGRPRFWQAGGGFDRNVRNVREFAREVGYIHQNPVTRGLSLSPQGWVWSSVHWWMGNRVEQLPCDPPPYPGVDWESWLGFKSL